MAPLYCILVIGLASDKDKIVTNVAVTANLTNLKK
jgi:hypothetical protein